MQVFSIRDAKSEVFHHPFFQNTSDEAIRSFQTAVNDPKTNFYKYPDDFDLYHIGEYDDHTGLMKSLKTPEHLKKAVHLVSKEKA